MGKYLDKAPAYKGKFLDGESQDSSIKQDSMFAQPEVENRGPLEANLSPGVPDVNSFLGAGEAGLKNLDSLALGPTNLSAKAPEIAGAMFETPALKPVTEALRREEAIPANILRSIAKGDASPVDLLRAGGRAFTGEEISTLGNYFEDIGFTDFASASAGFIGSMFLPSNLMAVNKMSKVASEAKANSKTVDSFLTRPKGAKGFLSEVGSKMTGVPREDFETAVTRGPGVVFANKEFNELIPRNISNRITNGLNKLKNRAGEDVTALKQELKAGGRKVGSDRLKMEFKKSMDKYGFRENREFLDDISGLGDDFQDLKSAMNKILSGKKKNLDDLLNYRDELGDIAFNGFKRGGEKSIVKPTDKATAVIREWRNILTKQIHDIAPELRKADRQYVIASALRERGAKFFDDVARGEKFLSGIDRETVSVSDKKLLRNIVKKVTGSEEYLDRVRFNLVNKSFSDFIPKGVLQRIAGGTALGVGSLAGGPVGVASIATGLLTSPRFVRFLLQSGEKGSFVIDDLLKNVRGASSRRALLALSSQDTQQSLSGSKQ